MKNRKKEQQPQPAKARGIRGQRVWKIVAIAVIIVFVLIIIGGLIKAFYFRSSLIKPTQAQIDYATKIAAEKLKSSGGNAQSFQVQVGRKMRRLYDNGVPRSTIQVSFYNNATSHAYLIDVNSGEILLHSETDAYGTWANHMTYSHHDSMRPSMKYLGFLEPADAEKRE